MNFDATVKRAYQLGEEIQKFIENCKKAPYERRTIEFYTTKLEQLQRKGDEFHQIHDDILRVEDLDQNNDYFKDQYYDQVQSLLTNYVRTLETRARELTAGAIDNTLSDASIRRLLRNQKALMSAIRELINEIMAHRGTVQSASYYNVTASVLEKYMIDFTQNNANLWESTDKDGFEGYNVHTYYSIEKDVKGAMIELQQHMSNEGHHTTQSFARAQESGLQLPKISLPKFNGDYLQWAAFKDLYNELVHTAPISDSQRIHYLIQALTDEPKGLIKHLPATGSNYNAAWTILTSRYDNHRLLISTLLNKFFAQPGIKNEAPSTIKSLHDVTQECIHGLTAQGLPVKHWDAILSHVIVRKMDQSTQTAFEQSLDDNKRLISVEEVLKFLERRFQSLEVRGIAERSAKRTCASATKSTITFNNCQLCKESGHQPYACKTFIAADLAQRWKWVKELNLCVNCLSRGHRADKCNSRHCTKCNKNHHSLLHNPKTKHPSFKSTGSQGAGREEARSSAPSTSEANIEQTSSRVSLLTNNIKKDSCYVLLGTARIKLIAANGKGIECRAVLDSGSQVNLITNRLLQKLGVKTTPMALSIEGVGANETKIRHQATIQFQSTVNEFIAKINAHVIPKIVADQPMQQLNIEKGVIPQDLMLADPEFCTPGRIDCLLGADIVWDLLTDGKIKLAENIPILRNSVLGWIVAGKVSTSNMSQATCGVCTTKDLEKTIAEFWEGEDVSDYNEQLTEDELRCETHFVQHTTRDIDGRFIVKLPLKEHPSHLSESRGIAYQRFQTLEKRFENNQLLHSQYVSFMQEYEALGHMTQIEEHQIESTHYFIPHHCVLRPESTSTKLRVVFDASAHKAAGASLNDILYNGPTVQSELFSILLRFRNLRYVMKTDIEKMYRQIWVHQADRKLQLILWREAPTRPIKAYQLNTITYGTRAAPYLATRCLVQLADENQGIFPQGSSALRHNFYVDDGLVGANTLREALEIQEQLISILNSAGMKLKKWCANNPRLLRGISPEDHEVNLNFKSEERQETKTLGVIWLPKTDMLCVKSNLQSHEKTTKRSMSSDLAHIYDPLGLIGPVLVTGKIQLQKTWQLKLDWDENLPSDIHNRWESYRKELASLEDITIPRHVFCGQEYLKMEMHAFADASEKAYGAVIYIRTVQKDKSIKVNLLCSKSRVAPLKQQTIPRLELCAALLASELLTRVKMDLGYQNKASFLWTDSQIVLSWINNHPGKLPVYVSHRIIKILRTTIPEQWRYVPSKQNPADILSRGVNPRDFSSCNIWLYGPLFLYQSEARWPAPFKRELITDDNNRIVTLMTQRPSEENVWIYMIPSKNSFAYVQRVVAYIQRFIKNARKPKESRSQHQQLSPMELDMSLKIIIRQIQVSDFSDIMATLIKEKFVSKSNHISSLTPFLDEEGIIRVGGRINSSIQQFDARHQMLLPNNDPLVKLLIKKIHEEHYHCGPQALLAQVRQRFWPLRGKSLVRSVVQGCIKCTKAKPNFYSQIMGNLPKHRVQPARPFLNSGVDYCGPFWVHYKVRGKRPQKAYIAVFCCFATKAVHLELVTELTTEAFIGALKRFIARRGHCKTLYSDNATNFVGAKNVLKEFDNVIFEKSAQESIIGACSNKGINFHFIPPRSPHFGGLWEAAVKSAKHLLIKNVSTVSLTYEELETVIIEIEAILNSRPLIPCSSNANDLNAITPGHFLIGEELTSSVDVHAQNPRRKLLDRWQLVSQLKQGFWQRWTKEYLNELQQRHKWKGPVKEIHPDTMVIIKEDNLAVLQWPLGRIIKTYKGDDGIVRVCDVKTQKGIFKRPIHRLAPLFSENEDFQTELNQNLQQPSSPAAVSLPISIPLSRLKNTSTLNIDETPPKRPRLNSSLIFTILALLLLPMALGNKINITKFDNKPGIYFEPLGTVKRTSANWKLIVYFDLEPYQQQVDILSDGITTLQKLCDNAPNITACSFLLDYFDHVTDEVQAELHLLSTKRTKRGALDIVGNLANSLFGVLDANYATQISDTIDKLKNTDDHIEELFRNQTSLIDSTINIVKQNQQKVQAKFDEIDNHIHQLLYSNKPFNEIQVSQNILMLSVQLFMIVSNMQRFHSSVMDVLIDSHHGKINPLLLTPQQLMEEILKIKSRLPESLHLPIHQKNLLEVYRIINVNGIVAKNHVVFNINIPLTDPQELQLLHLVPIVAPLNNTLAAVKLSTPFLAVSLHRDEFLPMDEHQLDRCWSLSEFELLCFNMHATYQATFDPLINKCEIDLLHDKDEPRCELYKLEEPTIWHQLYHPNQWSFATLNPIKLNAVCDDDTVHLTIDSSGLMIAQPNCIIKNDLITFQGSQQIVTALKLSMVKLKPPVGWIKQYTSNNTTINAFTTTFHELNAIQNQLAELSASTYSRTKIVSNSHGIITGYTAISLILVLALLMIYKWKRQQQKFHPPIPAPRQQTTEC